MNFILRHHLLLLLIFIVCNASSQTREVRFDLITGSNGITLGKLSSITQDKYGFIWLADQSNRAIIRFDGNHMKMYQYDAKNLNSPGGYNPECLAADSVGNIWIGFYGEGLDKFDPATGIFTHYRHNPKDESSLSSDVVSALLVDHLGNVWVGSNGGLDLLDQKTGKFKHYIHNETDLTSLSHHAVRALYEDKAGELWVGTGFFADVNIGGLNRFHRDRETFTRYLSDPANPNTLIDNRVEAIFEDSQGTFWVGTSGDGLHTMDRKTGLFERLTYDPRQPEQLSRSPVSRATLGGLDHITFITEDSDKKLWIGTWANGLTRYDPSTKKITRFGNKDDTSGAFQVSDSWCAHATPDGLIWLASQVSGLFRIDINNVIIPHVEMGPVFDFSEEGDSIGWYATSVGLVRKDFRTGATRKFVHDPANPNSISNNQVNRICKDKTGNFWIGTANGLNHFNLKTEIFTRYYHDPGNDNSYNVFRILEYSDSTIWVGTSGGGLDLLNWKTGTYTNFKNDPDDDSSISFDQISALYVDESNDLWVGTWSNKGLNKLNRNTGKFTHYLEGLGIEDIYQDASGIMWAGSNSGLHRYHKESDSFSLFDIENRENTTGLVSAIVGDKENNLWMSTQNGMYKLNKERNWWYRYGKENGVREGLIFIHDALFARQNGEIFLGDTSGYYAFFPEKLKTITDKKRIYFTRFWVNNKEIIPGANGPLKESLYETKDIQLAHDQNVFSFSATAIDFRSNKETYIHYQLENFDNGWRKASAEDEIQYYKVPPGKYRLRIKTADNNNGEWIEKSIAVIISPPWWNTWQAFIVYALLFMAFVYSVHRFQKNWVIRAERERTRERELAQAKEIEKAYSELKATQKQLIQSEKMASLGELTAGIAHEIQNPLNFVNNFSDVNTELIDELTEEVDKGNLDEVKAIAKDIKENEQKINHHGKRADAIVKGMLQHSRSSGGVKEPTDINALAEEYLRLAYHGLRAKDKSFNATMKTDFDDTIGLVNVIPEDIGRVILNLITNAFYVVSEKAKMISQTPYPLEGGPDYQPTVTVMTKHQLPLSGGRGSDGAKVTISVSDNGSGIPASALDKIFQPFFTTKPTGQGTGLGLSLSYDIIKAHGGELKVETKEGEGSVFIIQIPVS